MEPQKKAGYFVSNQPSLTQGKPPPPPPSSGKTIFKASGNRNFFFKPSPRKMIIAGIIVALAIGLPLTLGLLRQQQDVRQQAAASTTLSAVPPAESISLACGTFDVDVMIDPGENAVSIVELVISYDDEGLEFSEFILNEDAFPEIAREANISTGSASIIVSVGDNPANAIVSESKVLSLRFNVTGPDTDSNVIISTDLSKVYSVAPSDESTENVLSTVNNANFELTDSATCEISVSPTDTPGGSPTPSISPTPTDAACPGPDAVEDVLVTYPHCEGSNCTFDQASCSWTSLSGITGYQVKVSQVESGDVVLEQSIDVGSEQVVFDIVQDRTYLCEVSAVNACGVGPVSSHSLLCSTVIGFPTGTPTLTPTPPACLLPSPVTNLRITCPTCDLQTRP